MLFFEQKICHPPQIPGTHISNIKLRPNIEAIKKTAKDAYEFHSCF